MEVVTIVGCVAAVITAFEDGALIVQQIKERRRIRTALQPPIFLEKSLQKGAQRVEQAKDDGIQMFGAEFEIGDSEWFSFRPWWYLLKHQRRSCYRRP